MEIFLIIGTHFYCLFHLVFLCSLIKKLKISLILIFYYIKIIMKFYSKVDTTKILFSLLRFNEIKEKRTDISPDDQFLQTSGRVLKKGFKVKAHKHNYIKRETTITQEAWIVLKGLISAKFYDLDDKLIFETTLTKGDCVTIFRWS